MRLPLIGLSEPALKLLQPLAAWHEQHMSSVTFRRVEVPDHDDYGLEFVGVFEPLLPDACPVEIGITAPNAGTCAYAFLDKWLHIAERSGLSVLDLHRTRVGLYVEPIPFTSERLLSFLQAVAAGHVHLRATALRRRLVATFGWVEMQHERFQMHGIGSIPASLSKLGIGRTSRLSYAPWRSCSS